MRTLVSIAIAFHTTPSLRIAPFLAWLALAAGLSTTRGADPGRLTHHLDGIWDIADSQSAMEIPLRFSHSVPVPGLANLAQPAFPDVDRFISRENLANRIRSKLAPGEWLTNHWPGKVEQDRNYFWYRTTFRAPDRRERAVLKINKAQFGTAIWLNGQRLNEYPGCFTASFTPLDRAIRWDETNTLVVRIGAHPAVLPDTYPTGSDFEKIKWTPGIYDRVSVIYCDNPAIETVQVAPRIATGDVEIQIRLKNHGSTPATGQLANTIQTWQGGRTVIASEPEPVLLAPGEERIVTRTLRIPEAHLWTPEDPFLYLLESRTGGDSIQTRFGMREFRFDAATGRALLNGQAYYLRGSNITLHRFFEDPLCRDLPWNEAWVRQLLGELPRKLHWNYFRFCIGPVPDRWLEICDEEGLLIQNEFFVWTGGPGWYQGYSRAHDEKEMIGQYSDWLRDNWNHPSVAVWDANNETKDALFGARIIPAVRPLDLSHRPWENSYNPPVDPDDPVEYHPYLMSSGYRGKLTFRLTDLETMDGRPPTGTLPSPTNPAVINEYGWLWLNRDGSPTLLTENVYAQLLGTNATPRARLDLYSYLLAAKTEFWRAQRHYAGVIHFVYLTCSYPGVYTADHFSDVRRLALDPAFVDYVGEAFRPLGVYLNFFQSTLKGGSARDFVVVLSNDYTQAVQGQLRLRLETSSGEVLAQTDQELSIPALGQGRKTISLGVPAVRGACLLKATAQPANQPLTEATVCRRWVTLVE